MKKIVILLSFLLVFSLVSCADTSEQPPADSTEQETTTKAVTTTKKAQQTTTSKVTTTVKEPENPFAKRLEISYLVYDCENYEEGRWDEMELEEKFNIDLKVWNLDARNAEQITMMIAAGDWFDTGYTTRYDPILAYTDGLTRDVSLDQIKTNLPEYYSYLQKNPIGFEFNLMPDKKDHYYGLSFCYASNNYWYFINTFRLDWLENIGYTIDDLTEVKLEHESLSQCAEDTIFLSNRVFTFEEFNDIMRAFTEDDPDGNGEDDTFGAMFGQEGPSFGNLYTEQYTAMFGVPANAAGDWLHYDEVTGNYTPSYASTGWRDFLVFINEMLSKGYMNYLQRATGTSNYINNFYACLRTAAYGHMPFDCYCNLDPSNLERVNNWIPNGIIAKHPDAKFVMFPAILGPDGKGGTSRYGGTPFREGAFGTWTFSATVDDEKLERCLALLRYTNLEQEGFARYFWGIEGIHYKWMGEPFKSSIIKEDVGKIPKKYSNKPVQAIFSTDKFQYDFNLWSMRTEFLYQLSDYQVNNKWFLDYTLEPDKLISRLFMGQDLYDEYIELKNKINADVMAVANDFRDRAYKGELGDINAEWSQYIDAIYSAGLDQYVKIFNKDEFRMYEIDKTNIYK